MSPLRSHGRPCGLLCRILFPVLFLAAASSVQAQPQFYRTTLTLQEPVVNISSVHQVVYRWSTSQTAGEVEETEVEDMTLELHSGSNIIYVDDIVVDGVVQPFDGIPRALGADFDVFWRFNMTTNALEQMVNVSDIHIEQTTGLHFNVFDSTSIPDDGRVSVKAYLDGINQDPHTDQLGSQETVPILFFSDFETGDVSDWSAASP